MRSSTVSIAGDRSCRTPLLGWSGGADRIIADIASAQHSAVTRKQLERGVSRSSVDRRVADGRRQTWGEPPAYRAPVRHERSWADLLADRTGGRPRTHSEFERRLLRSLRRAGFPIPATQYEVVLPGGRRAFLDLAHPDIKLGLEADSYRHHLEPV